MVNNGVGVRHKDLHVPVCISGYPDICKKITISDLQKNGTTYPWLEVAKEIGVENFIKTIKTLNKHTETIRLPSIKKINYLKIKKIIQSLLQDGKSASDIYQILTREKIIVSQSFVFKSIREIKSNGS